MNAIFTNVSIILFFYYSVNVFIAHYRVPVHDRTSFGEVFVWHVYYVKWAAFLFFDVIFIWVGACFILCRRDYWGFRLFLLFVLWLDSIADGRRYLTLIQAFVALFVSKEFMCKTSEKTCFLLLIILLFQLFTFLLQFIESTSSPGITHPFAVRRLARWSRSTLFLTSLHLLNPSLLPS